MKDTTKLIVLVLAVLALGGCQNAATNIAVNNTTSNAAATAANVTKPAATANAAQVPASNLKPGDISLDKPVPAEELRNAAMGDPEAWKGKEVAVIGEYNGHSTSKLDSGDKYSLNVQAGPQNVVVKCDGRKAPPDDVNKNRKDRVFKGTVKDVIASWKQVVLEPCEVVK